MDEHEDPLVGESPFGVSAFTDIMDTLAGGSEGTQESTSATQADGAPVAGDQSYSGVAGETQSATDPVGGEPEGGPSGAEGVDGGDAEQHSADSPIADIPESWTANASEVADQLGALSTSLEERTVQAFQQVAYTETREEYGDYFDALEKHPRLLVGSEVPAIGQEGTEVLRDTNDAREWQEAVKSILVQEIRDRASVSMEDNRATIDTLHASIDLFKNNSDLIPGTATFNKQLADRFAALAKPYEVRVDGALQGYSIPVQPIIDSLRTEIGQVRKPSPAPTSAPATPKAPASPPQAGIASKAGKSAESTNDFSTLFGTIGLPDLQI